VIELHETGSHRIVNAQELSNPEYRSRVRRFVRERLRLGATQVKLHVDRLIENGIRLAHWRAVAVERTFSTTVAGARVSRDVGLIDVTKLTKLQLDQVIIRVNRWHHRGNSR